MKITRKMKQILLVVLCVLLVAVVGIGMLPHSKDGSEALRLYCPADTQETPGGDALTTVRVNWREMSKKDTKTQVEEVVRLLLGGCNSKHFRQAVPTGTILHSCRINGNTVTLDFSRAYGQLSGMDMTLADYCITLSLVQIPGIYTVRITVDGEELAHRDNNRFRADDVLLTSKEDVVRNLAVQLYFRKGQTLAVEERILTVYEGESQATAVLEALLAGPKQEGHKPLVSSDFRVLSTKLEEGVCYLNVSAADEKLLPEKKHDQELLLEGTVRSLCSIREIQQVQILVDGEMQHSFGQLDISEPISYPSK